MADTTEAARLRRDATPPDLSSRTGVARANAVAFAVLAGILLLVGGVTWERFSVAREARTWTQHSNDTLFTIKDLELSVRGAETGQRGFLLTGKLSYLAPYEATLGRVSFLEGTLQRLTADDLVEQDRLRILSRLIQDKLEELAQTIQLRRTDGLEAALQVVQTDRGRDLMTAIQTVLDAMTSDEQNRLDQRLDAAVSRGVTIRALVFGGCALAVLGLLWAAGVLNRALRQSGRMAAEQRTLALRLRTSLDSLSHGVAVFAADRRLTNWNQGFQLLLDLPGALVRQGTPYAAFVEQTSDQAVEQTNNQAAGQTNTPSAEQAGRGASLLESADQIRFGRDQPGEAVTYGRIGRRGEHLELRRTPMPDGGFVLTITDITQRAQAEGVLREAQKMQAIGQLTGGIAHDFNNLLTVILGNLEFLRAKLEPTQHALLARAERAVWAAQRGATLTSQLLAFARKQPLAPAPLDLATVIPDLLPLLRRTLGEQIELRFVDSAGLWPAMADAAQLESAVLNLALNARDAMPGGGRLTVELANKVLDEAYAGTHAEVATGDYAMLAVSDTGHGMTPEVVARVFEPFFTTKPDGKGTGLGLAMVFGFVKQSGGHIKIYSEPDEGTTVRIYLPRALGAVARSSPPGRSPLELPRGTATVLVVEDEPAVREIAVAILTDLGYRVLEAADGAEGLRVFGANANAIELLLTDVILPGPVRGREMAEQITALRPDMRTLFMSGYTENSIVHHGRLDDGVQLISKPFKREQLAQKVAEALGGEAGNVVSFKARRD